MLTKEVIAIAADLARLSISQNVDLKLIPGSPIDSLVKSTSIQGTGYCDMNGSPVVSSESLTEDNASNLSEDSDNSIHNEQMRAFANQIAQAVTAHLSFARNTALACVKDYAAKVTEQLANMPADPISEFDIQQGGLSELLQNSSFLDLLEKKTDVDDYEPSLHVKYSDKGPKELLELIETGSDSLDKDINSWLSKLPHDFLPKVWLEFFTPAHLSSLKSRSWYDALRNKQDGLNTSIAVFLLAVAAQAKLEAESASQTLQELQKALKEYASSAAYEILREIRKFQRDARADVVVLTYDAYNKRIVVNKPVYLKWISNGGSNEELLGSLVNGSRNTSESYLAENKESNLKSWQRYSGLAEAKYKAQTFTKTVQTLRNVFYSMLKEPSEIEQERFANPQFVQKVSELFEKELAMVTLKDTECIETLALKLMCLSRFHYTSSYQILRDIDVYSRQESVSVKQAALLATINYVTDYVADQIFDTSKCFRQ